MTNSLTFTTLRHKRPLKRPENLEPVSLNALNQFKENECFEGVFFSSGNCPFCTPPKTAGIAIQTAGSACGVLLALCCPALRATTRRGSFADTSYCHT